MLAPRSYIEEELVVLQLGEVILQLLLAVFELFDLRVFEVHQSLLVVDECLQHAYMVLMFLHQTTNQKIYTTPTAGHCNGYGKHQKLVYMQATVQSSHIT